MPLTKWIDTGELDVGILIEAVDRESRQQIAKWGHQDRSAFEWMIYLTEEVGELAEAISEAHYRVGTIHEIRKEAIQVATLALKIWQMSKEVKDAADNGTD